ncbi:YceD family protein [Desulfonatronovibrio magnus]|uniref:YceD family protein n=1 Tax=Desulfonatronovibrio magnus TaxID=698827 RepID=UPI0005EAF1C8|nr:DUF177 domain-containing protein [Desulfonatronovibrio magnus]
MQNKWLLISEIPVQGREFYFDNPQDWAALWKQSGLDCSVNKNLYAHLEVFPQSQGIYIKGSIQGNISLDCSRCLERADVLISHDFDIFEDYDDFKSEQSDSALLKFENGNWYISILQTVLEQFILALPVKIICSESCSGLCPDCGKNLNRDECVCGREYGDPRLAVFRNIKIQ